MKKRSAAELLEVCTWEGQQGCPEGRQQGLINWVLTVRDEREFFF